MKKGKLSLQAIIIIFVCIVVALSLGITDLIISKRITSSVEQTEKEKALNVAKMVALSPQVIGALEGKANKKNVQVFSNQIRKKTNVNFVVVMDMKGMRLSHPKPEKVGKHFTGGDEGPVLKGKEYVSISKGTLGRSMRAFTPIKNSQGKQVGAVAVGISLESVINAVHKGRMGMAIGTVIGILIGVIGAVGLARYLKRILLGLEPFAIARLLEERSSMLHSVREGIIAIDQEGNITLVNRAANKLLKKAGIEGNPIGMNVEEYLPETRLTRIIESGESEMDQEQNLHGVTILVNRVPVIVGNRPVGAIATFRDKTEVRILAEQLTGVRNYADALRAQAHEFMNKLHVILGLVRTEQYDTLANYVSETVNHRETEVGFVTKKVQDPVLAGFLIGKLSFARESGALLSFDCANKLPKPANSEITHELITIIGNLVDNAMEAITDSPVKKVELKLDYAEDILTVEVKDTGMGMTKSLQNKILDKGFSTKGDNRGFGLYLLAQAIERLEGDLIISSKPGKGTNFAVYIPYNAEDE
ncbi:DcuS/MalK family sensor histidine kinase [Paenibacillus sp. BSR1-1]|uniref:DcuS/MalK family sensor histidine kinase n=1 Tax=Paenibacillus sp. BSR1-1 TaxID=3020845 RepID=UPI0025AF32A3|nr:DcuS/MalK family sensor histidine kinase [Paenibacillus sp. BSR1-1]MDN3019452.1 DcuS/MalK family sensor histidine kinase [Paenibacillus sp. BSR1-1]